MSECKVNVTLADNPGYVNVSFDITKENALIAEDAGRTELANVRIEQARAEIKGYEAVGYNCTVTVPNPNIAHKLGV